MLLSNRGIALFCFSEKGKKYLAVVRELLFLYVLEYEIWPIDLFRNSAHLPWRVICWKIQKI